MAERCSNCSSPVDPGAAPPRSERGKPPKIPAAMTIWKDGQARHLCPDCLPRRKPPAKPQKIKSTEPDPLEGQRKAINENPGKTSILFPRVKFKDPPVKVGDLIKLQSCSIEITKVHATAVGSKAVWIARFTRSTPQRSFFLGRHGGYTDNPDLAMRGQDNPEPTTLDTVSPEVEEEAHRAAGEPPEPEAIPPSEVAELPLTVVAKTRYAEVQQEVGGQRLAEQQMKHLSRRLRRLQLDGIKYGVDLSPALIGMLREAEREVGEARRAAA